MKIILDHEGVTFERFDHFTTFFWATILLSFYSSKQDRVFFTVFHYAAVRVMAWLRTFSTKKVRPQNSFSSGALTFYHLTTTVLNAESDKGSENYVVLLNTQPLAEFLSLTKDYRELSSGETDGLIVVIRSESSEKLHGLLNALTSLDVAILTVVEDGVEHRDH